MTKQERKNSVKRENKLNNDCMTFVSTAIDFFHLYHFALKAEKTSKIRAKKANTFVAAVHAAYVANKLTEELYKEIAKEHNTATHRFKAYVAYFKANKYVVV